MYKTKDARAQKAQAQEVGRPHLDLEAGRLLLGQVVRAKARKGMVGQLDHPDDCCSPDTRAPDAHRTTSAKQAELPTAPAV